MHAMVTVNFRADDEEDENHYEIGSDIQDLLCEKKGDMVVISYVTTRRGKKVPCEIWYPADRISRVEIVYK